MMSSLLSRSLNELPLNYEPATVLVFDSTGMERWAYNLYDTTFLSFSPPYNTVTLSGIFQTGPIGQGNFFANLQNKQVWAFATEATYAVSRFTILDLASKKVSLLALELGKILFRDCRGF